MHVVHLISELETSGATAALRNVLPALSQHTSRQEVVTFYPNETVADSFREMGFDVHCLNKTPGLDRNLPGKIRGMVAEKNPELIHTHLVSANLYARLALRGKGPKLISHEHSMAGLTHPFAFVSNWLFKRYSDAIICVSSEIAYAWEQLGMPPERIHMLLNGVDPQQFTQVARERPLKLEQEQSLGKPPTLLAVGTLEPRKDVATLLRAMAVVNDSIAARLVLLGDGPLKNDLQALSHELGLSDLVEFAGAHTDVRPYLTSATLLVSASKTEGTSMAILEAMASGLPVIATSVGGTVDLAHDRVMKLVPPGNPGALGNAILTALQMPAPGVILAKRARERIQLHLNASSRAGRLAALYASLLNEEDPVNVSRRWKPLREKLAAVQISHPIHVHYCLNAEDPSDRVLTMAGVHFRALSAIGEPVAGAFRLSFSGASPEQVSLLQTTALENRLACQTGNEQEPQVSQALVCSVQSTDSVKAIYQRLGNIIM